MPAKRITTCLELLPNGEVCGKDRHPGKPLCKWHQKKHDHEQWMRRPGIAHVGTGNNPKSRPLDESLKRNSARTPHLSNPNFAKTIVTLTPQQIAAHERRDARKRERMIERARAEMWARGEGLNNYVPEKRRRTR